ncbi:hypothetical protein Sxan_28870 [Streptomyces xanthophaeus]|uniref:Uncharacterized protein n=1 Tax=Streptomyces xanthophaeus TaxID=67385 RepID=A0A919H2I9_9ACTN|nr:hypothetical protein Sxan_28870 [Streptomyces xanthophaeus]
MVDGLLLDFKSAKRSFAWGLPEQTAWQLLGHLLRDTAGHCRIDSSAADSGTE